MNQSADPMVEPRSSSCPACGAAVWAGVQFCTACGAAIGRLCRICGAELGPTAMFCSSCGSVSANAACAPGSGIAQQPAPPAQTPVNPRIAAAPGSQPAYWPTQARASTSPAAERLSTWKILFAMMASPGRVFAGPISQVSWPFALGVSGTAFTLFFLQTGLDMARAGSGTPGLGALFAILGAIYGTAGMAVLGVIASVLGRFLGGEKPVSWFIRAVASSFSPALVYSAVGLPFNLALGWNTALAFGVPGVVWALGPMTALFKEASGGKTGVSFVVAALCEGLVLLGWVMFTR